MYLSAAIIHEETDEHVNLIRELDRSELPSSPFHASSPPQVQSDPPPHFASSPVQTASPLSDFMSNEDIFATVQGPCLEDDPDTLIYDNWGNEWGRHMPKRPGPRLADWVGQEDEANITDIDSNTMSDLSDDEFADEHLEGWAEDDFGAAHEAIDLSADDSAPPSIPDDWWPWATREARTAVFHYNTSMLKNFQQEALLDIMNAFPHSVFSESEMEATLWFAAKCGVEDLPTVRQVKSHRDNILDHAGVSSELQSGSLGNLFSCNDFKKIVAHVSDL
jgi:hypothetical protein